MLAVLHGDEANLRTDRGLAGRVDHHVDQLARADRVHVLRNRDLAGFDRLFESTARVGHPVTGVGAVRDAHRGARGLRAQIGNRADFKAVHLPHLSHDVRAHLAAADQSNTNRTAGCGTLFEVGREAAGSDVMHGHSS
jgi:hypothetical protein